MVDQPPGGCSSLSTVEYVFWMVFYQLSLIFEMISIPNKQICFFQLSIWNQKHIKWQESTQPVLASTALKLRSIFKHSKSHDAVFSTRNGQQVWKTRWSSWSGVYVGEQFS